MGVRGSTAYAHFRVSLEPFLPLSTKCALTCTAASFQHRSSARFVAPCCGHLIEPKQRQRKARSCSERAVEYPGVEIGRTLAALGTRSTTLTGKRLRRSAPRPLDKSHDHAGGTAITAAVRPASRPRVRSDRAATSGLHGRCGVRRVAVNLSWLVLGSRQHLSTASRHRLRLQLRAYAFPSVQAYLVLRAEWRPLYSNLEEETTGQAE